MQHSEWPAMSVDGRPSGHEEGGSSAEAREHVLQVLSSSASVMAEAEGELRMLC